MNIVNPKLLYLLIILLPLAGLLIILPRRYKKRFTTYAEPGFWDFYFRDWSFFFFRLKMALLLTATAFIILALVRPQWDRETQDIRRSGLDIAVCIDASKSMEATDIVPSRLQRAKDQIAAFIDEQKGDRVALIPFAGTAFVQCPLTDDYEAAKMLLSSLDTNSVPVWGTDIGKALRTARTVFDKNTKTRIVVLISDGEDLSESGVKAARELAQQGIVIYTMGVGTPEGAKVTLSAEDAGGQTGQNEVVTKLDSKTLEKIASVSGGEFFMITPTQDEIAAILKHIASLERSRLSSVRLSLYKEQYHLFAIGALLLLLIETLISVRPGKTNGRNTKGLLTGIFMISLLLLPMTGLQALRLPWSKAMTNSKGRVAYTKHDYQKAEQTFRNNAERYPKDAVLQYNHGNALFQMKKDKEASTAWQKALDSRDPKLQSRAWHNIGNQQFQAKQYKEAMESYRKAVLADNDNQPARKNYDLAKRLLLKQQPQPQPQSQNQQQKQQQEEAERILKALEQKEITDRQNKQTAPRRMSNNKWW
jgi:Ca-activated chloride channel family protein